MIGAPLNLGRRSWFCVIVAAISLLFFLHPSTLPSSISDRVPDLEGLKSSTLDSLKNLPDLKSLLGFQKPLQVTVLNTKTAHDEVTASFFSALGQIENCRVDAFLVRRRWGIDEVYAQLPGTHQRALKDTDELLEAVDRFMEGDGESSEKRAFLEDYNPDVIILITGERDMVAQNYTNYWKYLLEETEAVVFAVIHHPEEWGPHHSEVAKPWIAARRFRVLTLSEHVTRFIDKDIKKEWSKEVDTSNIRLSTFPPVFHVPSLAAGEGSSIASISGDGQSTMEDGDKMRFAMQGDLIVNRKPTRDWEGTFERFSGLLNETEDRSSLELRLVGNGGLPPVPEDAKDNIKFSLELLYPEFYSVLHSATAILPAFSTTEYLINRASSTIPAAYIAEAPLIAGDALLKAYTYVAKEDVYYMKKGEDEMDVVARIIKMSEEERMEKVANVKMRKQRLVRESSVLLRTWMQESLDERAL